MKRLLLVTAGAVALVACTPGEGAIAPHGPTTSDRSGVGSTKRACDQSGMISLVLQKDAWRAELDRRLDQGVVFVAMPECDGSFDVIDDCHLVGSYKPASDDSISQVDKVRTAEDAARYDGGKAAFTARPTGWDVAMRGTVLKLDPKTLGDDPKGTRCADVTHILTGAVRGAFKLGQPDATEVPEAGKDATLIAVQLRSINPHRETKPASEHEQTGIIAPH